jgi:hypothetical protein
MFKCIYNFTAQLTGKNYVKGQKIGNSEYHTLRISEKTFFVDQEEEKEESSLTDSLVDIGAALFLSALDSAIDDDKSSSSDGFNGFEGGDFGGGGAGGDF